MLCRNAGGQFGLIGLEHVEMNFERIAVVHIRLILAAPAKRLPAGDCVQARDIDPALGEQPRMLLRPILADRANQSHLGEITRRIRKKHGRPAKHIIPPLGRSLDTIQSDRTNDEQ